MSFAPNPRYGTGMPCAARFALFWFLVMLLVIVLWRMASISNRNGPNHTISYSDFLQDLDKNNIATAELRMAQNTADVSGKLREPAQEYLTTVPKDDASNLVNRLRNQGANVEVSESTQPGLASWLINLLPLLLLVALWIFMSKRIGAKQASAQNPKNSPPSNTPL